MAMLQTVESLHDFLSPARPLPWSRIEIDINQDGYAIIENFLSPAQCRAIASGYVDNSQFRSRVVMARHNFGSGEYKYYSDPLPAWLQGLRTELYPPIAKIANRWISFKRDAQPFPLTHQDLVDQCKTLGQERPTPLLLRYGEGDYNCLHKDLYGDIVFPIQLVVLLSEPGRDFTGGEFVISEQRPRQQSRAAVLPLRQGSAALFAVNERPVQGTKRVYHVKNSHGVSVVRSGARFALGIIFHNAR